MRYCGTHLIAISKKILQIFIVEMNLKFTNLRLYSNPPGANELTQDFLVIPGTITIGYIQYYTEKLSVILLWYTVPEVEIVNTGYFLSFQEPSPLASVGSQGVGARVSKEARAPHALFCCTVSTMKCFMLTVKSLISDTPQQVIYFFDHSDAVGALPVGAAPTTSSFST